MNNGQRNAKSLTTAGIAMPEWSWGLPLSVRRLSQRNMSILLAPDVQMLDGAIQRMNIRENNCIILEIVIYPVDSVTHLTNNWSLA